MGFLDVNVVKKRTKRSAPQPKLVRRRAIINDVPSEVLQSIFVLSGNLDLPQVSLAVARKLRRTPALLNRFINNQISTNGLPVAVLRLPYVDAAVLTQLNARIDCEYIPQHLENFCVARNRDLVIYMLQNGHKLENSIRMYKLAVQTEDWPLASLLAQFKHRCSLDSVYEAANCRQVDLATEMASCVDLINAEDAIRLNRLGIKVSI